ncbi:MAG: glycosyltransferase family 39 protein [Anaerolineae bacterium]|nr:glycosyltransferase family 39 protein [Anaerolineae bacterium]
MLADWLMPTLALLPVMLGTFWGIGLPWALVILPRPDWRDRALVLTLGLALGVMLLTTGMFLLGTFGTITPGGSLAVGLALALAGGLLARRRAARTTPSSPAPRVPLSRWEWLILGALLVALVLRVIRVAYWPFAAYDALWVYGYNGRVFTLAGQIPAEMGYYPQLLPLTYTFGQLIWGGINDHAARAVIPLLGAGSMGAAYLLGARLVNRRVGMVTLALWAFFPAHADWARFGDLEVPLTFYFTLAALFFLLAWREEPDQPGRWRPRGPAWRYGAAAGLMLAGGMWTKPTAGALVWGIGLALLVAAFRAWGDWPRIWDRFRLVVWVGLWSAPIGGMWYIRNLLLGHPALVFPPGYWLTQAQRSGRQLGLLLLMLALLATWLLLHKKRADWRLIGPGLVIMIAAALPSAGLGEQLPYRMAAPEVAALLAGLALYGAGVWRWWRANNDGVNRGRLALAGGVFALVIPYWLTWFWSYSYHPRLAFAITPLQLLVLALLVTAVADQLRGWVSPGVQRRLVYAALILLITPGLAFTFHDTAGYLLSGELQSDDDKQLVSNYALYRTLRVLREEIAAYEEALAAGDDAEETPRPISIVAPGNRRLPFFFPELPIDTTPVTDLHVLDDGVTHFIDGSEADAAYNHIGQPVNPVRATMGIPRRAKLLAHEFDADFIYDVYRVNTARRFTEPGYNGYLEAPVVYPELAEVLGFSVTGRDFWPGRRIVLNIIFHVLGETDTDYTIYLHVTDGENVVATWDHMPGNDQYVTSLWEPGEYIEDQRWVELSEDVPPGTYHVNMGLYNLQTGERLPVWVGDVETDGFLLIDVVNKLSEAPE